MIDIENTIFILQQMFFVGHISIAFILSYFVSSRFQIRRISLSLVLFLSILPDIDILFRFVGTDIAHRTVTHSTIVVCILLLLILLKYRRPSIIVYFVAYLSHLIIGDLLVGPLNLLYPLGTFYLSGGIDFKTFGHIFVEGVLLATMAIIIFGRYYYLSDRMRTDIFPFQYSKRLDPIFYPLVIAAILISPVFLLDESQKELAEFPNSIVLLVHSYEKFNNTAILVLHLISTAIVILLWVVTRRIHISNIRTKQNRSNIANTNYN